METLDQSNSNQISERAIRNLSSSSVWVIIVASSGLFMGLFMLYGSFQLMSNSYQSEQASIMIIMSLIWLAMHTVGLNYGISLNKIKVYSAEDFDKASSKHNAYWIFVGIIYIILFLLCLMAVANGAGRNFGRF